MLLLPWQSCHYYAGTAASVLGSKPLYMSRFNSGKGRDNYLSSHTLISQSFYVVGDISRTKTSEMCVIVYVLLHCFSQDKVLSRKELANKYLQSSEESNIFCLLPMFQLMQPTSIDLHFTSFLTSVSMI